MTTFRPMNIREDAADMARLYNCTVVEPIRADTARDWWTLREGETRDVMLALDEDGRAIAYRDVDRETWMKPGVFYVKVIVVPERRGRGLGTRLYEDALQVAHAYGATHLESTVREADTVSTLFAQKRGFQIVHHAFASTLDLASFDERLCEDLTERLQAEGFHFFSLAEAGVTEENKRKLYEINRDSGLDNPGNDRSFPDFYAFTKNVFDASWFRADTQILAAHGDKWVGLSAIGIYPAEGYAYNAFTGVLRDYRGRGLARALKLQTILLAKKEGLRYIRTDNDSNNAPMLAVNRKLGYKPEPGYYKIVCVLNRDGGRHAQPA
jgi:GNAT superfamily N-acetyltransferase